jgi:hypothetical protein
MALSVFTWSRRKRKIKRARISIRRRPGHRRREVGVSLNGRKDLVRFARAVAFDSESVGVSVIVGGREGVITG